ncbi:cyclase family protein [bacterium]|nr:cyclase family protein [bacterium]
MLKHLALLALLSAPVCAQDLWKVYRDSLGQARYVDLSHTLEPDSTVWRGFGPSKFEPAIDPSTGQSYRYDHDGFEATRYQLSTDQLGSQLDPPAHWNPDYPAIDEIPVSYCLRPLVCISIVEQVRKNPDYSLQVADILAWEKRYGTIPAGSVVMVRSDWSKRWGQPGLAADSKFPGVSLAALKLLHQQRHILFHGHEPLDTDCSTDLAGEAWLLRNGYTQAEGVAHLDQVPTRGALLLTGFPKFRGGTGGYARFVAICPANWKYGVRVNPLSDSPLPKLPQPLRWDASKGVRIR